MYQTETIHTTTNQHKKILYGLNYIKQKTKQQKQIVSIKEFKLSKRFSSWDKNAVEKNKQTKIHTHTKKSTQTHTDTHLH